MKLIVGLGNPGRKYKKTRHNVGFMFLDKIADDLNLKFKLDASKKCEIAETTLDNEKIILVKPQTFMNLSGESVLAVSKYYGIDSNDILVFHDDMDLDVGRLRIRKSGSSAGHKGLQNIIDLFGTNEIARVKVGISKPVGELVVNYVLGDFSKEERIELEFFIEKALDIVKDFNKISFEELMSKYNK